MKEYRLAYERDEQEAEDLAAEKGREVRPFSLFFHLPHVALKNKSKKNVIAKAAVRLYDLDNIEDNEVEYQFFDLNFLAEKSRFWESVAKGRRDVAALDPEELTSRLKHAVAAFGRKVEVFEEHLTDESLENLEQNYLQDALEDYVNDMDEDEDFDQDKDYKEEKSELDQLGELFAGCRVKTTEKAEAEEREM
jgi:hypothetical protein